MEKSLFYKVLEIAKSEKYANHQTIRDLVNLARNELKRDVKHGLIFTKHLKMVVDKQMKTAGADKTFFYDIYFQILCAETPYSLDSYFIALEFNRPNGKEFYLGRREQLLPVVKDLERLVIFDEIDEMFLSLPPRVGKTTLSIYLLSWFLGVFPEKANLYVGAHSGLPSSIYTELKKILTDTATYEWHKIFPYVKFEELTMCNSKNCSLDTGEIKRYHSFTGKSIDSESLNGLCDCNGILVADDLVSGMEEALNKDRLTTLNMKVDMDMLTRAKENAKVLWIGTRWSLGDPIGRRITAIEATNIRYKVHNRPALNEHNESNFNYKHDGFSSQHYLNKKKIAEESGDIASFNAVYMQQPVERSGLLFPADELNYYDGVLPEGDPERIFGFCDPAFGGGDYTSFPIIYKFGNEYYVHDWIFDNGDKTITQPKVAFAIFNNKMDAVRFEANNGGDEYKEKIVEMLEKKFNYVLNITSITAFKVQMKGAESKQLHIFDRAPEIRQLFFRSPKCQNDDYRKAMAQLTAYTIQGNARKKKDDAPDSLAKTIDMDRVVERKTSIKIVPRIF